MSNVGTGAFTTWFEQRHPRERKLLTAGAALLIAALAWFLAIAPALQTYRSSSAAHAKLDEQLAQMQTMATEAKRLKERPSLSAAAAQTWLDMSVKKLGKTSFNVQGGRAQISFTGASPEVLAAWLTEARTAAQLSTVQANWKRSAGTKTESVLWDGTVVLELPSK
jgi:general secretion pathway protein M